MTANLILCADSSPFESPDDLLPPPTQCYIVVFIQTQPHSGEINLHSGIRAGRLDGRGSIGKMIIKSRENKLSCSSSVILVWTDISFISTGIRSSSSTSSARHNHKHPKILPRNSSGLCSSARHFLSSQNDVLPRGRTRARRRPRLHVPSKTITRRREQIRALS